MQFFTIQLYFGLITQHIISNINNISNFGEIVRWVHFGFGWVHHFGNPPSKSTHYLLHRFSNFPFLAMVQWRSFFRTWKDFAKPIILLSLVNESKIGSRKIIPMQLHTNGFFGKSLVVMHQVPVTPYLSREFGENTAVSFCFDFLPRPSKKHKKIPFL